MGRKGPRAKTKIVLKSVSKVEQLGSMPNLKFQTFLNKNHPNILRVRISQDVKLHIASFLMALLKLMAPFHRVATFNNF